MERAEEEQQPSLLCNPQLRDPLTVVLGFMPNPGQFRTCCQFTLECFQQAVYLEGFLPVALVSYHEQGRAKSSSQQQQEEEDLLFLHKDIPVSISLLRKGKESPAVSAFQSVSITHTGPYPRVISSYFLSCLPMMQEFRLENLPWVQEIGREVLKGCPALRSVTMKNLPRLTQISSLFLYEESSLKTIILEELPELTSIGEQCMTRCTSLKTITIQNLPRLSSIGYSFLYGCEELKEGTFADLPELVKVGQWWMDGCSELEKLVFRNLPKLTDFANTSHLLCPQSGISYENCSALENYKPRIITHDEFAEDYDDGIWE